MELFGTGPAVQLCRTHGVCDVLRTSMGALRCPNSDGVGLHVPSTCPSVLVMFLKDSE